MKTSFPLAMLLLLAPAAPAREDALPSADDVADVEALDVRIDDHEKKRYVLIGWDAERKPPKDGYRLLVVLPGGTGAIDFHPFCKRIAKHVLDERWLLLQIVAPVWAAEQAETLVWPTREQPWEGMEFATEDLVFAAIEDVKKRTDVDRRHVFTMTWSSSGPAGYAMSLAKDSPVTGTFVAMSVFKPENLPSLDRAKKHPYFLLHSEDDFIPIAMARRAETELAKKKAKVKFLEVQGGHGWHGDVYGNMKAAVRFLEENAAIPRSK